ncbi:MAG: class D sortase [Acidobacteriia bacterium]|nr:class D sortase [Terriglobia bacterium]
MRTRKKLWLQLLSGIVIAFGAFLLARGVRVVVESRVGQSTAEREFREREQQSPARRAGPPKLGEPVAKLSIPRLGTELYVFEGTDGPDLRLGPGHMPGTVMPGDKGNCVIAAHRDTHFRVLKDVHQGDQIVLENSAGRFVYVVDDTSIVRPTNTRPLQPTRSAVLNLITCYPFYYLGHAPKRFIVTAKLEEPLSASVHYHQQLR